MGSWGGGGETEEMTQVVPGQGEDPQAALKRCNLPGTVMLKVVSSINRSVQYTEGLEYSRAAQGRAPCALRPAGERKPGALEQGTGSWGTREGSLRKMEGGPGGERGWAERGQRVAGKTDCVERGPRSKTGQVPSAVRRTTTPSGTDRHCSRLGPQQGSASRTIPARGCPQPRQEPFTPRTWSLEKRQLGCNPGAWRVPDMDR